MYLLTLTFPNNASSFFARKITAKK